MEDGREGKKRSEGGRKGVEETEEQRGEEKGNAREREHTYIKIYIFTHMHGHTYTHTTVYVCHLTNP